MTRRIMVAIACVFAASITAAQIEADGDRPGWGFLPGTTITLKPRKETYFLGENIILDYEVSYAGEDRLEVANCSYGDRTRYRPYRAYTPCYAEAYDEDGKRVPESTLRFSHSGQSWCTIPKGGAVRISIPLTRHCRFEKPGRYRIRAVHDLGWSRDVHTSEQARQIPKEDPRWTDATIVLAMPDAAQARSVVEHMCGLEDDAGSYQSLCGVVEMRDYADFSCLQYPIYLPILEDLAWKGQGNKGAVIGIAHIPTEEATEALVRLLKHPSRDFRILYLTNGLEGITLGFAAMVVGALHDRLPEPPGPRRPDRVNPLFVLDADPQLVRNTWRDAFSGPVRDYARSLATEQEPIKLECAAFVLQSVGTAEDMPALNAAFAKAVPLVAYSPYDRDAHWSAFSTRRACLALVQAVRSIVARKTQPPIDPESIGEIIHFVVSLELRPDFRPPGWEEKCAGWTRHERPFVRELLLRCAPRPVPEQVLERIPELLADADANVVIASLGLIGELKGDRYFPDISSLLMATSDSDVLHDLVRVALSLDFPRDELLGMLVDRLGPAEPPVEHDPMYRHVYRCLGDVLFAGKHEGYWPACTQYPSPDEIGSAKAAWKLFLQDHGEEIRKGAILKREDPAIDRAMFPHP